MATMEASGDKLEAKLKHWGYKLEELGASAGDAGSEARAEHHKHSADLRVAPEAEQEKPAEFKAAGGGEWDDFEADIEKHWRDIEETFTKRTL